YNIHDGDQFHVDLKPDPFKSQHSNRTVDITRNTHEKKLTNNSTSSEDDKKLLPFSFDSLQNLSNQNDTNILQSFIQLDQFYSSIDKNSQILKQNSNNDDDDDDLLSAAAVVCTQMKKN
ncbi:unnamed protein product, partial [Rotaria sordida]